MHPLPAVVGLEASVITNSPMCIHTVYYVYSEHQIQFKYMLNQCHHAHIQYADVRRSSNHMNAYGEICVRLISMCIDLLDIPWFILHMYGTVHMVTFARHYTCAQMCVWWNL